MRGDRQLTTVDVWIAINAWQGLVSGREFCLSISGRRERGKGINEHGKVGHQKEEKMM